MPRDTSTDPSRSHYITSVGGRLKPTHREGGSRRRGGMLSELLLTLLLLLLLLPLSMSLFSFCLFVFEKIYYKCTLL